MIVADQPGIGARIRSLSVNRYLHVALVLLLNLVLTGVFFIIVQDQEQARTQAVFKRQAQAYVAAIQKGIERNLEVIESIGGLYGASGKVERDDFRRFVQGPLSRNQEIQALSWNERVTHSERRQFEDRLKQEGYPEFQFKDWRLDGQSIERPEYIVVTYIEPYEGNQAAMGLDVASNPTRLAALEIARDTGEMTTTARIKLVQEAGNQYGFLILKPIYKTHVAPETVEGRRQNLIGFAVGVFRIRDMVEAAVEDLPEGMVNIQLVDEASPADEGLLYLGQESDSGNLADEEQLKAQGELYLREPLEIPGRQWSLLITPTQEFTVAHASWLSWAALAGGLLITALLLVYLIGLVSHASNLNAEVAERQRAEEEQKRLAEEKQITSDIGQIITSTLDIDEVYEKFALEVKKLVNFDRVAISIIDQEAETYTIKYVSGEEMLGRGIGQRRPLEGSATQRVMVSGQTEIRQNFADEIRFPTDKAFLEAGLNSDIRVPMHCKGQVIGTLSLRSGQPGAYGPREQAILECLASQIAPAVENALLYEQTLKDMTERELLQERLNQSQRMDSIGQLAGGVAHDFNNLLTVITGYTTMLLSKDPTEPADTDQLRAISKAAESGSKLTNQLLGFSRRQVIKPITLDLSDAAMSSYGMLRRVIGENIELVMLPAQDLPSVFVDPTQLDQIVMNLVLNARDAMTEGGTLTVATSHHQGELSEDYIGDCVVLSVSDTGVGMSEEVKAHLFEPFYTTKETGKGTGLGLATCYGIVEQNGGHIEVDSEPGRGSTFKIYLPVTEEREGSEPEDVGRSVSSSPSGTETILLVEDEPQVRAMESCILADQGYDILQAANGEEALQVCQANQDQDIQLLITDMVMPRMSGDELITELSSRRPEIKFLVVSGYAENTLERSVVARSDVHFMQKPFKPMELAETVRDILDGVSEPVA